MKKIICTLSTLYLFGTLVVQATTPLPTFEELQQIKHIFASIEDWKLSLPEVSSQEDNSEQLMTNMIFDSEELSIWLPYTKTRVAYEYNGTKDNVALVLQTWDGTSSNWNNVYRQYISFTPHGYLQQMVLQVWNDDDHAWLDIYRDTYTYDEKDNVTGMLTDMWNLVNDNWRNVQRSLFTYDDNNYLIAELVQEHDHAQFGGWRNVSRKMYAYDDKGNEILNLTQLWDRKGDAWLNAQKNVFNYNNEDAVVMEMQQTWDSEYWVNVSRHLKSYNPTGELYTASSQYWDDHTEIWKNGVLETSSYDDGGRITQTVDTYWIGDNEGWLNTNRKSYIYDQGFMKLVLTEYWDEINNEWLPDSKCVFNYEEIKEGIKSEQIVQHPHLYNITPNEAVLNLIRHRAKVGEAK